MRRDFHELHDAVVEEIKSKAYTCGYNAGNGNASKVYKEGYKLGCKDAWKLAADIECMNAYEVKEAFGVVDENVGFLCNQFTYEDALQRFRKWREATTSWEDVPADDMTLEQARQAVKDLRKKLAESKKNNDIDVLEVTLLSVEEAGELPKEMLKSDHSWWLRSPGYLAFEVALVDGDCGDVIDDGGLVDEELGVRPALKLNLKSLKRGISFFYKGYEWEMISDDTALCKSIVGKCAFNVDGNNNEYESSDIKQWLNDWWKKVEKL